MVASSPVNWGLVDPRTAGWQSRERRRQLPRTAGSLSRERRQEVPRTAGWESRERRRKLPRTAGMRAQRDKTQEQTKDLKKRTNQNEVKGRRLLFGSGLLSRCTQQGETTNTQTRKYFKIIVFNDNIKGRQGKVDTPGITSRPDKMEFNKQDLNTHWQITHTWNELTHNYMKRGQETNHIRKQEAGTQDTHETPLTVVNSFFLFFFTFRALSYSRRQARRKCFIASFSPTQLSFSRPAPRCLNSKCTCTHLCAHGRAGLKTRCVQTCCWHVAILKQLK